MLGEVSSNRPYRPTALTQGAGQSAGCFASQLDSVRSDVYRARRRAMSSESCSGSSESLNENNAEVKQVNLFNNIWGKPDNSLKNDASRYYFDLTSRRLDPQKNRKSTQQASVKTVTADRFISESEMKGPKKLFLTRVKASWFWRLISKIK